MKITLCFEEIMILCELDKSTLHHIQVMFKVSFFTSAPCVYPSMHYNELEGCNEHLSTVCHGAQNHIYIFRDLKKILDILYPVMLTVDVYST